MKTVHETFEEHLPKLEKSFHEFPWENQQTYATYLAQTYYYVCHSTKLLAVAAQHTKTPKLASHLLRHKKEETGHDKWAMSDVKTLGYDVKTFPIFEETKNVYESIYKEIEQVGPAAIMAYAMSLEGVSARALPSIYEQRIRKSHGEKACMFVKGHADADPHHIVAGFKAAELLPKEDQTHWNRVFIESIDRYIRFLNKIRKVAATTQKAA